MRIERYATRLPMKKLLFAALLALTLWLTWRFVAAFSGISWSELLAMLQTTLSASTVLLLGVLTALFYMLDWVRFRSVLAVLGHGLRLRDGVQLTAVSYFVTSLAPAAELHTPAMVHMLARKQVSVSDARWSRTSPPCPAASASPSWPPAPCWTRRSHRKAWP